MSIDIEPPVPTSQQRTATLPYELDDRTPFVAERDAKLTQDIKEIDALIDGAKRLLRRVDSDGPRLLNWFPSALRYLVHTRLVGPVLTTSNDSYFGRGTGSSSEKEHLVVLRVLVMLEILDWCESVLEEAEVRTRSMSEIARKRLLQGELIRILVSSEDLKEVLEQESDDLREYRQHLDTRNCPSRTPTDDRAVVTTYAHPLLDRGVPATNTRHSTRPDLVWAQSELAPSVLSHSRQRVHSFPLALGPLARSVIMGTINPNRVRTRAKSLGDALGSG